MGSRQNRENAVGRRIAEERVWELEAQLAAKSAEADTRERELCDLRGALIDVLQMGEGVSRDEQIIDSAKHAYDGREALTKALDTRERAAFDYMIAEAFGPVLEEEADKMFATYLLRSRPKTQEPT